MKTTKRCLTCKTVKPVSGFYREVKRSDGLKGICRECDKELRRNRIAKERSTPEGTKRLLEVSRERFARYRANGGWKKFRPNNIHKIRARRLLKWYVRSGRIGKPSACSKCGAVAVSSKIHGHHTDYNKPLDVQWLCEQCHLVEHFGDTLIKPLTVELTNAAAQKKEG